MSATAVKDLARDLSTVRALTASIQRHAQALEDHLNQGRAALSEHSTDRTGRRASAAAPPAAPPPPVAVQPLPLEPPQPPESPEEKKLQELLPHVEARPPSAEELCFTSAMSCFEGWLRLDPAIGPKTMGYVTKFITRTLERSHSSEETRETLSRSVEVWIWLTKCFAAGIPSLTNRTLGQLPMHDDHEKSATAQETAALVSKNYTSLRDDIGLLLKLMHIARNIVAVSDPEVPQDLCAAAQFDQMLYQLIILCVNVTSKGYDTDAGDETARTRLNDILELFKKLLIVGLQQAHNWMANHDRNKMTFWSTVLFDDEAGYYSQYSTNNPGDFRPDVARIEVQNWIERNSRFCDKARQLLVEYEETIARRGDLPGRLPRIMPLAWNWLPEGSVRVRSDDVIDGAKQSRWKEGEADKFEQDRAYAGVSMEVDSWWLKVRDPNYEEWVVPTPTVEFARTRLESCKANLASRYAQQSSYRAGIMGRAAAEGPQLPDAPRDEDRKDVSDQPHDYNDDLIEDEDLDDDESYGEGPMGGLLTEIPNILDPTQIEALHMIVRSCIMDTPNDKLLSSSESLSGARCRMFLALECGRGLLRELLVYVAVWAKDKPQKGESEELGERHEDDGTENDIQLRYLILELTTQIIEAIHNNGLIPFAWQSLRIPKDIISPAQTVLLRLVHRMFQTSHIGLKAKPEQHNRDMKLLHFLFLQFRSRIVPECVGLMQCQAQTRDKGMDPVDFPADSWDMDRARDGLLHFIDLFVTVVKNVATREYFVTWEITYELLMLLQGLNALPKNPLVEPPSRSSQRPGGLHENDDEHDFASGIPPPPPSNQPPHLYPWKHVKDNVLHFLSAMLQPPLGRSSPGNPRIQQQIIQLKGVEILLQTLIYDNNSPFAKERVPLVLKWLTDGSPEAKRLLDAIAVAPPSERNSRSATNLGQPTGPDNLSSDLKARLKALSSQTASTTAGPSSAPNRSLMASGEFLDEALLRQALASFSPAAGNATATTQSPCTRSEELLRDIITLTDDAAKLTMGKKPDSDETEEEDFM